MAVKHENITFLPAPSNNGIAAVRQPAVDCRPELSNFVGNENDLTQTPSM